MARDASKMSVYVLSSTTSKIQMLQSTKPGSAVHPGGAQRLGEVRSLQSGWDGPGLGFVGRYGAAVGGGCQRIETLKALRSADAAER